MSNSLQSNEQQRQRARAVKTAWLLGFIALAIFTAFIAAAVTGR